MVFGQKTFSIKHDSCCHDENQKLVEALPNKASKTLPLKSVPRLSQKIRKSGDRCFFDFLICLPAPLNCLAQLIFQFQAQHFFNTARIRFSNFKSSFICQDSPPTPLAHPLKQNTPSKNKKAENKCRQHREITILLSGQRNGSRRW